MSTILPPLHTSRSLDVKEGERHVAHRKLGVDRPDQEELRAAFHQFIRLLLGGGVEEDEVVFATFSDNNENTDDVIISDFALDLRTNKTDFDVQAKFIARVSRNGDLELNADAGLVALTALESLATLLGETISKTQHTNVSVLNHPPQKRPVAFAQEPEIEQYPALLHGSFERRAAQFPDRVAIDFLSIDNTRQQWTYREADAISTRIAATITRNAQNHSGQKRPVAIVMGPSPELYISYLAALKAGHPFCPIPVDAPLERQEVILDDLECAAILTRQLDSDLPLFGAISTKLPVINTSPFLTNIANSEVLSETLATGSLHEDDLAYIMYTSGSTGKPKGCQISHLSATCSIAAHSAVAPLNASPEGPPSRWFQFAAPTFDPSIMEIFVTLSGGGTLCCAERQLTLDNINAVLAQMEVDVMMATPSLASLLNPVHLKSLWTMGEALSEKVIGNFAGHNPDPPSDWNPAYGPRGLYNAYGPTEAAINCTLLPHVPQDNRGSVLGPPLPSCALIIIDERDPLLLQPVPLGCAGELLIAGPQVSSRGYLNRPEETAKAFLPDTPWGRSYRTGDRARIVWDTITSEPSVEFLGRISSDQVKLSGRRVELGEIDAAVMQVDAVQEALTVVYRPNGNDSRGSEQPITGVSLCDGASPWDAVKVEVEQAAEKKLPPFMRPYRLFLVPQMPRSAAGKLDRKALSILLHDKMQAEKVAPPQQESPNEVLDVLPAHLAETEDKLLDILADIVGSRPAPNVDLVSAVGLDSLRAMHFLSRVRAEQLVEGINLQDLLSGTTIRQLLLRDNAQDICNINNVESMLRDFSVRHFNAACSLAGVGAHDVEKVLPSTATQSGMVASFMRSSHGSKKTYINHSCYHLNTERMDMERFVTAIETTLAKREAYRTTFVPVDDSVAPFAQITLSQAAVKDHATWCQVFCRTGTDTMEYWLHQAEEQISLERNVLYHFQVIDGETLIISLFHGIFDGASLELLLVDIEKEYYGLPLEPRSDISLAASMHFGLLSKQTDEFWLQETSGYQAESLPVLSGNKSSSPSIESDTRVLHHTVSFTYANLQPRSREIQASPLSVWQTAWAILLDSFQESQTGDIMFGSVVSNRFQVDSAVCHGPTFSMLPCRMQIDGSLSVGELVQKATKSSARILAHPHPSLGLITTAEGKLPFDSLLALQHFEVEEKDKDGPAGHNSLWNRIEWPAMRNDFGVMLEIWPVDPHIPRAKWKSSDHMCVKMTFNTSLFDEKVAARILEQLSGLASAILERPEQTSGEVLAGLPMPLLSVENMNPKQLKSAPLLLHEQFENEAKNSPEKVALNFTYSLSEAPIQLTYGELNAKADTFAKRIHRHFDGAAPIDQIIPICMEKSPELYIAILGILKAGAAWCPIDTAFPAQRKLELARRTGSDLVVTSVASRQLCDGVLPHGSTLLLVDELTPGTEPLEALASVNLRPEHLAYLIWTSGTTGAPKGVMVEHSAAVHAMRGLQESIPTSIDMSTGLPTTPRVLNFCAYSFDVFVQDLFYTWGLRGTLISSTREIMLGNFVQLVLDRKATHAHLTPSFSASVRRKDLGDTLQVVTMIGEKLTESVAEDWSWNTKLFNTYGPAEAAVVSTLRRVGEDEAKAGNVGWSLPSISAFVVDAKPPHRLVPFYGVGELALGGYQLARGYLNDPAKTKASFIWSEELKQRIYLTGDVVRMVDHGIEFLGRNDDLVKLNGIRVELSEISATIAGTNEEEIEHVETLLLGHPTRPVKAVVAFVSIRGGEGIDGPLVALDKLAETLREKILSSVHRLLPDYMVPSSLVLLNQMPRTASNKVDRKVLQAVFEELELDRFDTAVQVLTSTPGVEGKRTRTPIDEQVVAMLAALANVDAAAISDEMSLARLGIHSISAIRLTWRLRKEADLDVSIVDILTCFTIGQLLDKVSSVSKDAIPEHERAAPWLEDIEKQLFSKFAAKLQPRGSSVNVTALRPATAMQEALVIETLRNERSYWSHRMFRLPQDVDLDRLRAAWEIVERDNEMLRTSFLITAGIDSDAIVWLKKTKFRSPVLQAVTSPGDVRWSEVQWDSSFQELATIAEEVSRRARDEASPIASNKLVSPWSISILMDSVTGERALVFHIHHALHDAVSMDTVFDDVSKHYHCHSNEVPKRTQFGQAMRLGLYPTKDQMDQAQNAAKELYGSLVDSFGAVNTTKFPDMTGSRQQQPRQILRTTTRLSSSEAADTWSQLQAAMKDYNFGSPTQIVSVAFGSVLAEYLESKYIVLGKTISLRIHGAKLQTVVGPLVATVPNAVRIDVPAKEMLSSMASSASRSMHHVHPTVLRSLLEIPSDQPLYPALIVFHPREEQHREANEIGQFWDEMEDLVGLCVEHPLALNIFEDQSGEGLLLELSGDNQVLSKQQLELLLDQVISQLNSMLRHPDVPLEELNNELPRYLLSVTPSSGASMLALEELIEDPDWTGIPPPTINPVAWVEFHAAHHPDWIAAEEIVDIDEPELTRRWTYPQLLEGACRVLAELTRSGVPRGGVVAVHLGRTLESFAAITALFRGGYIYLPLDEELPPERTRMLAIDSGAKAFITTKDLWSELKAGDGQTPWNHNEPLFLEDVFDRPSAVVDLPPYTSTRNSTDDGYILFTSGSSGIPKGVRVTSFNLCNFIECFAKRILDNSPQTALLGGKGKYLNLASRAFDPHLTHMFMAWRLGMAATIGPRMMMLGNLESVIVTNSITHFGTVPSVLQQARLTPNRVPSVVFASTGGEKVSNDVLGMWTENDGEDGTRPILMNAYGPTECTIGCSANIVSRHSNVRNVGCVFDSATAIVFAKEESQEGGKQVIAKRGQAGELCVAGDLVSLGYISRPEAQARAFATTQLLLAEDGSPKSTKFYKTGDLVRMMADGSIEYLGRSDQQAKVNGQRLELGEVEHFLRRTAAELHAELEFAAAVIEHPELPRPRLFAFIAGKQDAGHVDGLTIIAGNNEILGKLAAACSGSLPAFMVPDLVWINRIPLMKASGKVDVKQLNVLVKGLSLSKLHNDKGSSDVERLDVQPLNEDEQVVVEAIEQTLGSSIKRPDASRSIFELGLDSLSAVHLSARLKQLGFDVTAANVLSHATIRNLAKRRGNPSFTEELAASLERATQRVELFERTHRAELVSNTESEDLIEQVLPAMPLQSTLLAQSMALLGDDDDDDSDVSQTVLYVTHFRYSLDSSTELPRFLKALATVLQAEEMLRTCFRQDASGKIAQVVLSKSPLQELVFVLNEPWDSAHLPNKIAREIVQQISHLPPIRIHILDAGSKEVLLSIHHSLFDGDAMKQLRVKIQQAYSNPIRPELIQSDRATSALKSLAIQFEAIDLAASKNFWQANLENVEPCLMRDLSTSIESEATSTVRAARRLSMPLSRLRHAAQANDTSLNALFQTAFSLLLSELLPSRSEIVFGCVLSLRPLLSARIAEIDSLVAPCLNTLPQRVLLSLTARNGGTLADLAKAVRQNLSNSMQHALVPFDRISKWSRVDQALFDAVISVNMHSPPQTDSATQPSLMTGLDTLSAANTPFAADINIHDLPIGQGYVEVEFSSNAGVLDVANLVQRFEELCTLLAEQPNMQLSSLLPSLPANPVFNGGKNTNTGDDSQDTSPWTGDEILVRDVVSELLKLSAEDIRKQTSLYRLGIDSILVLRMVKLLRERAGVRLSPLAVLRARCVAAVAVLVGAGASQSIPSGSQQQQEDLHAKALQRLSRTIPAETNVENCFLATPLQQGMLNSSLTDEIITKRHSSPYVYRHTFELIDRSNFDLETFKKAWQQLVERVEILRTTFHFTGDNEYPWIGAVRPFSENFGAVHIYTSAADAANNSRALDVSVRSAHCNLVISDDLDKSIMAVFVMHHAIYDGSSLPTLWATFIGIYQSLSGSTAQPTQQLFPFKNVARHIAVHQASAVDYWAKQLNGYTYQPLIPLTTPQDSEPTRHRSVAIISREQYETIKQQCQNLGVPVQAALILAWSKVLAMDVLQQSDVVFGQVLNGQFLALGGGNVRGQLHETEDSVIGPTFNTVAVRVALSATMSNRQALDRTQKVCEEAQQHQVASLRAVQNKWRSSTSPAGASNLFESLFLFNGDNTTRHDEESSHSTFWRPSKLPEEADEEGGFAEYTLVCNVAASKDGLQVRISADPHKIDCSSIKRLSASFTTVLVRQLEELDAASVPTTLLPKRTTAENDDQSHDVGKDRALCDTVLNVVRDLLGDTPGKQSAQDVNVTSNLFRFGLDSILAIRLSSKLRRTAASLTVNQIMQGKTVAGMLALKRRSLEKQRKEPAFQSLLNDDQKAAAVRKLKWNAAYVESVLPCLAGQEHHLEYWMFSGHRFFEAPWIYKLKSQVSAPSLQGAWDELRKRHAILRSTFVALEDGHDKAVVTAVQVTQRPACVDGSIDGTFTVVRGDQSATLDQALVQHLQETNNKPSDLKSPPVRLALITATGGDAALVMRLHHTMYDAWSIRMLLKDMDSLLAGREISPATMDLVKSVHDVNFQRNRRDEKNFWSQILRNAKRTILSPSPSTEDKVAGPSGPQHLVRLPSVVTSAAVRSLETLSQESSNTSLSPVILLAFAQTLAETLDSPCSSPTFGFYHASRSLGSLDLTQASVPTLTLTPLTVRTDAPGDSDELSTTIKAVQGVQSYLSQLTQFGQASMHDVLKWSGKEGEPLFNSYINLLYRNTNGEDANRTISMTILERLKPSTNTYFTESKPTEIAAPLLDGLKTSQIAPLRIFMDVVIDKHTEGVSLGIRCDRGLYDEEHVHQFAGRFVDKLLRLERVLKSAAQ